MRDVGRNAFKQGGGTLEGMNNDNLRSDSPLVIAFTLKDC